MSSSPSFLRQPRTWVIAVVALAVVIGGGLAVINAIQGDDAERLSFEDIPSTTPDTDASSTTADAGSTSDGLDGTWEVAEGTQAGYLVPETLFGNSVVAGGRTPDVTGSLVLAGTTITSTEITVDMTTVTSDRSQRDGQFHGRIMSTDQFPEAIFELTEPIELGSLPEDGAEVTAPVTGELTLRGVTNAVTFEVKATRTGDQIAVLGTIPVNFDDYEIPDASGGPAQVGREGEVDLLLVFSKA
ncbi:MAG: YceI family protein [Actinomycetota bacterium]|nr:YceI family protein [Actinomycetota bacterium]